MFSCLRLGFTVLRVFLEWSYFFPIFIAEKVSQFVQGHMKFVTVLKGELDFPDSQVSGLSLDLPDLKG